MFAHQQMLYADEQKIRMGRLQYFQGLNGLYQKVIAATEVVEVLAPLYGSFIEQTRGIYVPGLLPDSFYVKVFLATDPRVRFGASGKKYKYNLTVQELEPLPSQTCNFKLK